MPKINDGYYLSMPSTQDLQCVLDQPVYNILVARADSQFLCCTRVLFVWYSVAWGSVTFS